MAMLGQTVTIINRSGKVVNTSKHLSNLFGEAKAAYNERKAEIQATRRDKSKSKDSELEARRKLEGMTLADDEGKISRRAGEDQKQTRRKPVPERKKQKPPVERGVTDSFYTNDNRSDSRRGSQVSHASHRNSNHRHGSLGSLPLDDPRIGELARRYTDGPDLQHHRSITPTQPRRASYEDIDMDLAYGELPPPLPPRNYNDEVELRAKMSGLQRLLDEFNCLQHSFSATIEKLQKNPDALAAVALTLAEISNLASKMAPGALMTMKTSFPTIIALLASPEFAIAIGVGVGVTIIAFGGYKIIKKINGKKNALLAEGGAGVETDELREIDRIENWRRGIAEVEAESMGTSVDGEFITPRATRTLIESGRMAESDLKPKSSTTNKKRRSAKRSNTDVSSSKTKSRSKTGTKVKSKEQPSGLRTFFKSKS